MMPENDSLPASPPVPSAPTRSPLLRSPWPWLAVAALLLSGWQWLETRQQLADTQREVARQLTANSNTQEDHVALKQLSEQVDALQAKLGAADSKLAEFEEQTRAQRNLAQDLLRSRDESALLDLEQALSLAEQQLQLNGNAPAALLTLQAADARLARLDRPQFLPLRKALARDLAKLAALPFVDLAGLSLRLEQGLIGIDQLPLASYGRPPAAAEKVAAPENRPWWRQAGGELWLEIKGLIRIQRFDREEPVLLAPGQEFFLRENLKLRLLNARLALFAHDQATFRNELKVAQAWLNRHFDAEQKPVQAVLTTLHQLEVTTISGEVPNLNDSQAALRALRNGKEKR